MAYAVIHNATIPVGTGKTFREAQAILESKVTETESELRRLHPDAEIRVSGNQDSAYIDALHGETLTRREFYRIEEAGR